MDERAVALAPAEQVELAALEATIEQNLAAFVAVGTALLTIRDKRLYRRDYHTFEAYCGERWGLKRQRAYELMEAASVVTVVSEISDTAPGRESHAAALAALPPEQQPVAWVRAVETLPPGERMTATHVERAVAEVAGTTILHSSASAEWHTPAAYVAAVHELMGGIDLDPASNARANETVRATQFYTVEQDGLSQPWFGRVFLNPPYGKMDQESNQGRWSRRLVDEYRAGRVAEAVLLVNATPSNQWFLPLWDFPICFTHHRIRFTLPSGEPADQPTHSNCFVYLGSRVADFVRIFSRFGVVVQRVDLAA